MLLTKAIMMTSMLFMMNMSPMTIMMGILVFSSMTMFVKWMETSNAWIPLIFSLAFLGGMMIIFMYIVSISKNKNKKNKNKLPIVFVFASLTMWSLKYGSSPSMVHTMLSSFFSQYMLLCYLIVLILFITTKIINSPFKALKGAA